LLRLRYGVTHVSAGSALGFSRIDRRVLSARRSGRCRVLNGKLAYEGSQRSTGNAAKRFIAGFSR
jgi:hypothetical protein